MQQPLALLAAAEVRICLNYTLSQFATANAAVSAWAKWGRVVKILAASQRNRLRFHLLRAPGLSGATLQRLDQAAAAAYTWRVFQEYYSLGGLEDIDVRGKSLLELGPGDLTGVGLLFLARGAARFTALDRFRPSSDPQCQLAVIPALADLLCAEERARLMELVRTEHDPPFDPARFELVYGAGAEQAGRIFAGRRFDLILSRAVLEEIEDPDAAFAAMDRLLAPGGRMLHKIDLSDYGMFSSAGFHPLEFLTIPSGLYRWMRHDQRPNRRPLSYYRAKMSALGYRFRLLVTEVIAPGGYRALPQPVEGLPALSAAEATLIREIRPRLAAEFRALPDEELSVAGVFLVAQKVV